MQTTHLRSGRALRLPLECLCPGSGIAPLGDPSGSSGVTAYFVGLRIGSSPYGWFYSAKTSTNLQVLAVAIAIPYGLAAVMKNLARSFESPKNRRSLLTL